MKFTLKFSLKLRRFLHREEEDRSGLVTTYVAREQQIGTYIFWIIDTGAYARG